MAPGLRWPLPAVLAWAASWVVFELGTRFGLSGAVAMVLGGALGPLLSLVQARWWRRLIVAAGFPLSLLASGAAVADWVWLALLALVLLVYPVRAWRDAPLFPTPAWALSELPTRVALAVDAQVLDAGCGLGDALIALHRAFPMARLHGLEWSWPLRAVCALRCPWASVRHGDMWRGDWRPYALVYLFQRPESMLRAARKAATELTDGSWLVSLEFEADSLLADARIQLSDGRTLWLYQMPFKKPETAAAKIPERQDADRRQSS